MPWQVYNSAGQLLQATDLPDNAVTNAKVADDAIGVVELSATGTASSSTFLRGDNAWAAVSVPTARCRVTDANGQSIANESDVAIIFDTERFDTDTMHDNSTNNTRITFTTAGTYIVGGHIQFPTSASGARALIVRKNGSTQIGLDQKDGSSSDSIRLSVNTIDTFAATDYVELVVYQDSGGSLTTDKINNRSPEFFAAQIQ